MALCRDDRGSRPVGKLRQIDVDRARGNRVTRIARGYADRAAGIVAPGGVLDQMGQGHRLSYHDEGDRQQNPQARPPR